MSRTIDHRRREPRLGPARARFLLLAALSAASLSGLGCGSDHPQQRSLPLRPIADASSDAAADATAPCAYEPCSDPSLDTPAGSSDAGLGGEPSVGESDVDASGASPPDAEAEPDASAPAESGPDAGPASPDASVPPDVEVEPSSTCGDGQRQGNEECDDGNLAFGDGCGPRCQLERCGNGRVDAPAEECDPPGTERCSATCRNRRCGDGVVDPALGEACDDGNIDNGDGCSASCAEERCGNGRLEAPEQCEPPNTASCDISCRVRPSSVVPLSVPIGAELFRLVNPQFLGALQPGAVVGQCLRSAPGLEYQLMALARLPEEGATAAVLELGARFHRGTECSGSTLDGVSSAYPLQTPGQARTLQLPPPLPIAGFSPTFAAPEEAGSIFVWAQLAEGSSAQLDDLQLERASASRCGDGVPEGDEQCEPSLTPQCTADCRLPFVCGDGLIAPGECEEPARASACPAECPPKAAVCGDGVRQDPEECDPPGPTCSNVCTQHHSVCGDGRVDTAGGEECDPPNGESCDGSCRRMQCGDGRVQAPEECDPPGRDCSAHCRRQNTWNGDCRGGLSHSGEPCEPAVSACQDCLAATCSASASAPDLFAACYQLPGVALAGPAKGVPLRQLCADVVECLRSTGCEVEGPPRYRADPASCYCGKALLAEPSESPARLRACRDGTSEARGSCRAVFERAAESTLPGAVLVALDPDFGKPALSAALRLMSECGQASAGDRSCAAQCRVPSACGNGVVEAGEMCDPNDQEWGNHGTRWPQDPLHPPPACDPVHCTVLPCGNGKVDTKWPYEESDPDHPAQPPDWKPETCDVADPYTNPPRAPGAPSACSPSCQIATVCGDGLLTASVEACDPGPTGSWTACCRPGDTTQLAGCDRDGSGVIEPAEGCVAPAICGNQIREGAEQCDPPTPGSCDSQCRRIEAGPCAECTQQSCAAEYHACFESEPSTRDACTAITSCIETSGCRDDISGTLGCLCGDRAVLLCQSQGGNGACQALMSQHAGCGDVPTPACVYNQQLIPGFPLGVANQLLQCRNDYCWDQCFGPAQ